MNAATAEIVGDYRYSLTRTWDFGVTRCVFLMLNPSTADALQDDPTIRRCIGFAKREHFGGIEVLNLYAYRATNPRDMLAAADPVGPENDRILAERTVGRTVIAAWGVNAAATRVATVLELLPSTVKLFALGATRDGHPRHPLYVRGDAPLIQWPSEGAKR